MTKNRALAIFLKKPEPGRVKTRLAKDVGEAGAVEAYISLYETVIREVSPGVWDIILFIDQSTEGFDAYSYLKEVQSNGDLGQKMLDAFQRMLEKYDAAIIIGSDCPYIASTHIDEAYLSLETNDLVLGPTTDGGYYLIGLKKPIPELFKNINWSTETVLKETISVSSQLDLTYHLLPELTDIDTITEWKEWVRKA